MIDEKALERAIAQSTSWAEVCRLLGRKPATGSQTHLKKRAISLGISYQHFTGQAWAKGRRSNRNKSVAEYIQGSSVRTHKLKLKLFDEGIKAKKCEHCNITHWMNKEITFHLDHINCNENDWRLDNLQILCPNCHGIKTRHDRQHRGVAERHMRLA